MGKMFYLLKNYLARADVFADVSNVVLFDRRKVVEPGSLKNLSTDEVKDIFEVVREPENDNDAALDVISRKKYEKLDMILLKVDNIPKEKRYHLATKIHRCAAMLYLKQMDDIKHSYEVVYGKSDVCEESYRKFFDSIGLDHVATLAIYIGTDMWGRPGQAYCSLARSCKEGEERQKERDIRLLDPIAIDMGDFKDFTAFVRELSIVIMLYEDKVNMITKLHKSEKFKSLNIKAKYVAEMIILKLLDRCDKSASCILKTVDEKSIVM